MPKTVEELVEDRKNTGNVVYEDSLGCYLKKSGDGICKIFTITHPVKALWYVE